MTTPLLTKKYAMWVELEATYGTDSVPTVADAVLVDSLEITFAADIIDRDNIVLSDLSKCSHLIGKYSVQLSFNCDLRGSGTAGTAPDFGKLIQACSMSETVVAATSVTYAPESTDQESVSVYVNKDGILHKIVGCVGTWSLTAAIGQPAKLAFTMQGKLKENPTAVALTTGTTCTLAPPLLLGATFTYDGWSPTIANFSLDLANKLTERQDVTDASGIQGFFVSDRKPVASFDPEVVTVATRNVWDNFRELNEGALSLAFGVTSGNLVTIAAPKCVKRSIPYGDRDGISTYQIQVGLIRTTGNDEFSIKLK